MIGKSEFQKHRPADRSDPGFTLPGKKLRWISGKVQENNGDRPWVVLRKGHMPKDLIEHIEKFNPDAFLTGETIRRGDLVLGFCSEQAQIQKKAELKQMSRDQASTVAVAPDIRDKKGRKMAEVEHNEDTDVSKEMIERFKAQKEKGE